MMKRLAALAALLVLTGCGSAPAPAPQAPPPATAPTPATGQTDPAPASIPAPAPAASTPATYTVPSPAPAAAPTPAPTPAPAAAADAVQSVQMTSPQEGWALTRTAILRTADGGRTWQDVTPPASVLAGAQNFGPSDFLNGQTGWVKVSQAGNAAIVRTADAGKTWEMVSTPTSQGNLLSFADATHGWWLGVSDASMGGASVDVYSTTDGGKTWTQVSKAGADQAGSLPRDGMKNGVVFKDASNGWVTAFTNRPGYIWLYRTTDGGNTWRRQDVHISEPLRGQQVIAHAPRFFSAQEGILPVTFTADQTTIFYRTTDGGETWNPTAPVKALVSNNGVVAGFSDPSHGWASDGATLSVTTDGGESWRVQTPGMSLASISQLDFATPQLGWAVMGQGEASLLATTDGGATWTPVR